MKNTPKTVGKINFLVHPGFLAAPDSVGTEAERKANESLFEKYVELAGKTRENELMVLFSHASPAELKRDLKEGEPYTKMYQQLRNILGNRLFVYTEDGYGPEVDLADFEFALRARGYAYDPNTVETTAGGETLGCCVEDWSNEANSALELAKKTVVDTYSTDMNARGGFTKKEFFGTVLPQLREQHDRLEWV